MFNASRLAALMRSCGIPVRQATELANILGGTRQKLKTGGGLEQDTTPSDLREVTPDARRHHLTNVDFRKGDPDFRPSKIDESERRPQAQPDPAIKKSPAPQETDANYNLVDGSYTSVQPADGAVAVNLSVHGSGRAMMLDPPSNSIVGKTLRCEAGGGGSNQTLVRFFIDETGQEVVWKLMLAIERMQIVTDMRYRKGRGIEYTTRTAAVFIDPADPFQKKVVPFKPQEVVSNLDKNEAGTALIATRVKVEIPAVDTSTTDTFAFGGSGSKVRLCKTTSDWLKGTAATLPVYSGTPLSETVTGETVVAYNRIGKVLADQWVFVAQADNGQYYLVEAEKSQASAVYHVEIVSTTTAGVTTSKLVFRKKKFWVQAWEDDTAVELGLTECVTPYSNTGSGGY
jgi:hypothetical protein